MRIVFLEKFFIHVTNGILYGFYKNHFNHFIGLVWCENPNETFRSVFGKYMSKKMQDRFGQQFEQQRPTDRNSPKEGETVIDKMPNQQKTADKKVGEYIDYEEID